jgi:hypothetical protein
MNDKISKDKNFIKYLKINPSSHFDLLSEKEYSKELNNLPKIFNENIGVNEDKIKKFFNNILPESKEGDILKINFALSSGCKKHKKAAQQSLNDIMNMKENSYLILSKDLASKLSQIIKEIFRRIKKYSNIKTYEELLINTKDFLYKGGNIITKFMVEKKENVFPQKRTMFDFFDNSSNVDIDKSKSKINKTFQEKKTIFFQFKDIKEEKKNNLPAEMRCLIKKFSTIKNLKLSINNNKSSNKLEEFNLDLIDIQNIIIILYNSEWLFQNLLEIEIDLSNDSLLRNQFEIQYQNLRNLSELLNRDINISVYHFGLGKNAIFNPYQLSNFYSSFPKLQKDNFLYVYQNINDEHILTYDFENENDEEKLEIGSEEFINNKKYILEIIVVYAYFLLKIKNIRICYLKHPINYREEIIKTLKNDKIYLDEFNILGFFKENFIHHFTIDFNSLDSQSFQKVLNFISLNGLMKICRINFFESEEYFKSEILYKILQINENKYQDINKDNFKYNDNNKDIYDLKPNENLADYILRKLFNNFKENISNFFYLISMRTNISELSLIFDIPKILFNHNNYITIILKLILNLLSFINSPISNLGILSIQAESLILNGRNNIYLVEFFDKLNLYNNINSKIKSLTFQCKFYHIINIHKLIPYGIEYLSIGSFDLETFINFTNYLTSVDFSETSKLKKLQINLNNSIFKYEQCKEYLERLLIEHPRNLTQISIYTNISIAYKDLKELLLKSNYNIIENIYFCFNKASLKDEEGYKDKLKLEEYNHNIIIDRNFIDLYYAQRKKKNTKMILELMTLVSLKFNKSFSDYNIFLNIEKFVESNTKKINVVEFK